MSDDMNDNKPDGSTPTDNPPSPDGAGNDKAAELEAQIAKLQAERDAYKAKFDEAKSTRDKAKAREREEAEKKGEYEKLVADLKAEIEELKPRASEYETIKAQHDALVQQQRESLLAQLPKDAQAEWQDANLETLTRLVKTLGTAQPNIPGTHNGAGTPKGGAKAWNEMSWSEKVEFQRTNSSEAVQRKIAESRRKA